jgi:heat shock protein HslJ
MNAVRALAVASVVMIVLAACGGDDDEPAADTTAPAGTTTEVTFVETTSTDSPPTTELPTTTVDLATALADRTFLSTAVEGYQLVEGSQIMLTFQADRIGASAGCNQMSSTWSLDGELLVVPDMATTQMACEDGPGHVACSGVDVRPYRGHRRRRPHAHRGGRRSHVDRQP